MFPGVIKTSVAAPDSKLQILDQVIKKPQAPRLVSNSGAGLGTCGAVLDCPDELQCSGRKRDCLFECNLTKFFISSTGLYKFASLTLQRPALRPQQRGQ